MPLRRACDDVQVLSSTATRQIAVGNFSGYLSGQRRILDAIDTLIERLHWRTTYWNVVPCPQVRGEWAEIWPRVARSTAVSFRDDAIAASDGK